MLRGDPAAEASPMRALIPRLLPACALLVACQTACDDDDAEQTTDAALAPRLDAAVAPVDVWQPPPDVTWQWQLDGDRLGANYDVQMYDVDLFDQPASAIGGLQAAGRKVICYFSAGSAEDWRPDHADLPEAAQGKALGDWPGERWLDIRSDAVWRVMEARLDLAREKGCDGVEPDNVNVHSNDSGFPLRPDDQLAFNRRLAAAAHARGLAIGLKNDGDQIPQLVGDFDFALNEECHAFGECAQLKPFVDAGKAALNVEYAPDAAAAATLAETVCPASAALGLRTLILPLELNDAFRVACD
jgi:hypothetical protein